MYSVVNLSTLINCRLSFYCFSLLFLLCACSQDKAELTIAADELKESSANKVLAKTKRQAYPGMPGPQPAKKRVSPAATAYRIPQEISESEAVELSRSDRDNIRMDDFRFSDEETPSSFDDNFFKEDVYSLEEHSLEPGVGDSGRYAKKPSGKKKTKLNRPQILGHASASYSQVSADGNYATAYGGKTAEGATALSKLEMDQSAISAPPVAESSLELHRQYRLKDKGQSQRAESKNERFKAKAENNHRKLKQVVIADQLAGLRQGFSVQAKTLAASTSGGIATNEKPAILNQLPLPFFTDLDNTQNLTFKDAEGYWANSYIPGSARFRALQMQVQQHSLPTPTATLTQSMIPPWQPFDAPRSAAMGLYLQSNKNAVNGPTRLLLQVGLKSVNKKSGRRPAMNMVLLLDARHLHKADHKLLQGFFNALLKQKRIDDSYTVLLAGNQASLSIPAEEFRFGTVQVFLQTLFDTNSSKPNSKHATTGGNFDLSADLYKAMAIAAKQDNPNVALGSSSIVLITANDLQGETKKLLPLVHQSAIAGIPISVMGLGNITQWQALHKLCLAGQGYRHWLQDEDSAAELVTNILSAVSKVVARALRVNIRLAKNVKLIDVLGSRALNQQATRQQRQTEQAIDLRLAKNMGIEADRSEDDAGIQIIIPGFMANNDHVILLDLLVDGAGPIADVTVRYKDLLQLKNHVIRASLSLPAYANRTTQLQMNVLKNRVIFAYRQALQQSSAYIKHRQLPQAQARLQQQMQLLHRLQQQHVGLQQTGWIQAQLALLGSAIKTMQQPGYLHGAQAPLQQQQLSDSLMLSQYLQIFQRDPLAAGVQ
ncbi:MAG: hypothetical protein HRU20_08840 [Pseudomonadales bacterium]|nr:hypothetical protein [Pseudomonadales bacterium]